MVDVCYYYLVELARCGTPLNWTRQVSHSNPLVFILSHSLQSTLRERDGKKEKKFLYFSIIYVMQWFECDIKITIMSTIYFSA